MEERANIVVGVVLGIVLAIALVVVLVVHVFGSGPTGMLRALVHDGDGKTHEISLLEDSTTTITSSLGTNVIVVQDGAVFVSESDCEKHYCVLQGKLSAPGGQIICLPHKLWIEVVTDPSQASAMNEDAVIGVTKDFDAVSQ
ncbi:MAG: NusG domain II-containing protein [Coriobacteriia bacterium]|nr:NusG domain II-containing protein [Coriobacteriia bacterium]